MKCAPLGLEGAFVVLYPLKVVDNMAVHRTIPLAPPRQLPYFGVQCVHVICGIRRVRVLKPSGLGELQNTKDKVSHGTRNEKAYIFILVRHDLLVQRVFRLKTRNIARVPRKGGFGTHDFTVLKTWFSLQ